MLPAVIDFAAAIYMAGAFNRLFGTAIDTTNTMTMIVVMMVDYEMLRERARFFYGVSIMFLVLVIIAGTVSARTADEPAASPKPAALNPSGRSTTSRSRLRGRRGSTDGLSATATRLVIRLGRR